MRRTNFTEYLELMQNCDLWETLGQIKFSSGENMNKVTAQDHEMKIYWVHLELNEIPRAAAHSNFTCWINNNKVQSTPRQKKKKLNENQ